MDLWEYHATLCSDEELERLVKADFPATLYNTYCDFDDASVGELEKVAEMIARAMGV